MSRPYVLLNISGPYGAGKDTLLNRILEWQRDNVRRVSSLTTRLSSPDADPSYTSVTHDDLAAITASGRWIVTNQIGGEVKYGTSLDEIESVAAQGRRVALHSIYPSDEGAGRLRRAFADRLFSVGVLVSHGGRDKQLEVLRDRLLSRGRDDESTIEARLRYQEGAIDYVLENPFVETPTGPMRVFDRIVVNDDLASAQETFRAIWLENIEPTLLDDRIRTDHEILASARGRVDAGSGYFNPVAGLPDVGTPLPVPSSLDSSSANFSSHGKPTDVISALYRALIRSIPPDHLLFGLYARPSFSLSPYLYDEECLADFEAQVADGSLTRIAFHAVQRDAAIQGLQTNFD